jgi:hypothetical protein
MTMGYGELLANLAGAAALAVLFLAMMWGTP